MTKEQIKEAIIEQYKTIFDPEIPVNIWELGLVYEVNVGDEGKVDTVMTLTAPGCPVADQLLQEVKEKTELVPEVTEANVKLTFEPEWNPEKMSEEARLELGFM